MKKITVITILSVILAVIFISCGLYSNRALSKVEYSTSKEVIGLGVVQIPTVVTLDVAPERLSHEELYIVPENMGRKNDKLDQQMYKELKKQYGKDVAQKRVTEYRATYANKYVEAAKDYAKAKLLIKYGADVLVDPKYSIETINNERIQVIVSGYLGTYKNFRPMVEKDTALIKIRPSVYWGENKTGKINAE